MTSLRKEVVLGILTREPRTCWSPTPQSSRPTRILHCPPGEGADSIKEKEREREHFSKQLKPRQGVGAHSNQLNKVRHPLPGPHGKEWAVLGWHPTHGKAK